MAEIRIFQEGLVEASQHDVYRFIADYAQHHHKFLPPEFSEYKVEHGGFGAGTEITFRFTAGGQSRIFHGAVDEPQPGTVIREAYSEPPMETTFHLVPQGESCRVRIESRWETAGVRGMVERIFAPRMLRRIYVDELDRLARYAREELGKA